MAMVAAEIADQVINNFHSFLRNNKSTAIGTPIRAAKGQPSNAEMAIKNMDKAYFCCHQAAKPAQAKYMEKEEGSKAVLETNMPTLNS